jgi:hypothetical protein
VGKKNNKDVRARERERERPKEREEKDSFVRWRDETVIVPGYQPYTLPAIHPTKQVRPSERFGRPLARARARSLSRLSLSLGLLGRLCLLPGLVLAALGTKKLYGSQ